MHSWYREVRAPAIKAHASCAGRRSQSCMRECERMTTNTQCAAGWSSAVPKPASLPLHIHSYARALHTCGFQFHRLASALDANASMNRARLRSIINKHSISQE